MVDNEKRENLANARRKLKKFRNQQQHDSEQNGNGLEHANGTSIHSINGANNEPPIRHQNTSQDLVGFVDQQQAILNGINHNLSKSPVMEFEEQNRQYALLIENQKQQRARLEDQRQFGGGSSVSGRSSQTQPDIDVARQLEQKYRRDLDHFQEQLEIHVQTIGILVAEKTDFSAKLNQSFKQLERKQNEMDELQGRLKASRERVQELEKQVQNSTSSVQKREMAAKESDKENDRLKLENIRQSQMIEDMKQTIEELNGKFNSRQQNFDQLNVECTQLKQKLEQTEIRAQQFQSTNDTSITDKYQQQIEELQRTVSLKTNEAEVLLSSMNQTRSDSEQLQLQYQQYSSNMHRHAQELNDQINQLMQTNSMLKNENEAMQQTYEMKLTEVRNGQITHPNTDSTLELDAVRQENHLFKSAIDEWSKRCESMRVDNEHMYRLLAERDEHIVALENNIVKSRENGVDHEQLLQSIQGDKTALSRAIAQNKQLKEQLTELQEGFVKMSNDNMNLTNRVQAQEHVNKQLGERLAQKELELHDAQSQDHPVVDRQLAQILPTDGQEQQIDNNQQLNALFEENNQLRQRLSYYEQQPPSTSEVQINDSGSLSSFGSHDDDDPQLRTPLVRKIIERFNRAMRENADLQDRTQQLEHLILQLQSETDTIGDYIYLYQQQRQQLHRRYQEKDDYIKQLTQERLNLQKKLSELETLFMRGLNKPQQELSSTTIHGEILSTDIQPPQITDENDWPELVDNGLAVTDQTTTIPISNDSIVLRSSSMIDFDDETKIRILTLLKELGQSTAASSLTDSLGTTKLAFIDKNLYVCSTCSGPVQWV